MKKLSLLLMATALLVVGCEDDDNSSNEVDTQYIISKTATAVGFSDIIDPEPGDIRQIDTSGKYTVIVTSDTIIQALRPSGSGYSSASLSSISIGDCFQYRYYPDDIDPTPNELYVRARVIIAGCTNSNEYEVVTVTTETTTTTTTNYYGVAP
jgi:hypothetical protein